MFSLFSSSKSSMACFSCAHQNSQLAHYCELCGAALSPQVAVRSLAEGELAISFTVKDLSAFFAQGNPHSVNTQLHLVQNQTWYGLTRADNDIGSLAAHHTSLALNSPADLFISRCNPFVLVFAFDDLHTAEFLPTMARFHLHLQIQDFALFVQGLMAGAQQLNQANLQALLAPMVRQIAMNFINAHALRELQDHPHLQTELDACLMSGLTDQFAGLGLQVIKASTQELRHDKLDAEREHLGESLGSLYLIIDEQRGKNAQHKQLDTLYNEREWQKIANDEESIRLVYRRAELRQALRKDLSWMYLHKEHERAKLRLSRAKLKQDEAERLHAIQLRELELYTRVADASSRKDAIERGAQSTVRELEQTLKHTQKGKAETRQNEADQWLHIRTLARIKMLSESELMRLQSKEAAQLMQQQITHRIALQQLQHEIAQYQLQARLQEQQTSQSEQAAWLHDKQKQIALREQQIEEEAHKSRLITISLETEVRAREFQRMQAWEEELHQQRQRALLRQESREDAIKDSDNELTVTQLKEHIHRIQRSDQQADAIAQHEKLLRTLEANARYEQQQQDLRIEAEESQWRRQQQSAEAAQVQQAAAAQLEITRLTAIANFSETGKIATAKPENAAALTEIVKLQTQASMSAEQILASQAGLSKHAARAMNEMHSGRASTHGMSWEDTVKFLHKRVEEEREQRRLEQERRHEIDLTVAQQAAAAPINPAPRS